MERFVTRDTLRLALARLYGTAGHLLNIWFALKQMGFGVDKPPVVVTTSSPTSALQRLFSFASPDGLFLVPFAHTSRFLTMEGHAGRSVVQTNIQRWKTSGSVVTCDPTGFLQIDKNAQDELMVAPTRNYPLGLGQGRDGFALGEGTRTSVPDQSFAVWYYRQTGFEAGDTGSVDRAAFTDRLRRDLGISNAEYEAVFVKDDLEVQTSESCISDHELHSLCSDFLKRPSRPVTQVVTQSFEEHALRIRSMQTVSDQPSWLRKSPSVALSETLNAGAKAVLLFGPPRTGKTRAIDAIADRSSKERETIQIHDGWGYDHLIEGLRPDSKGVWDWIDGPLKVAIDTSKKFIVLEEINRTSFTQAVGEVFSLIEDFYRGPKNAIRLRSGKMLFVPDSTVFLMTMNTLDKSTEDIDDAMLGRFAAISFQPRVEDLTDMLVANRFEPERASQIRELFAFILENYPLGHGYFAALRPTADVIQFYVSRVRPVLENHFRSYAPQTLALIDNKVDTLFAHESNRLAR